jgi:HD-GYP domain-containing protein (c-di-GMP phosphodiesterase class II)
MQVSHVLLDTKLHADEGLRPATSNVGRMQKVVLLASPALAYSSLVLDRLLAHACTAHGATQACLLATDPLRPGRLVAVAGCGRATELIGTAPGEDALPAGPRAALVADGEWHGMLALGGPADADPVLLHETAKLAALVLERRDGEPLDPGPRVDALVGALQSADAYTEGHCRRVAALACEVARELGLDSADLIELELTARLHDVGKLRVPPEILDKPGPLDDDERAVVRLHPGWGAEMVARIPGLEAVALLVRLHHERIDGDGYPHGLAGERIPIASRIVAACDAYSAIVDDRPYRAGQSSAIALAELRRTAGTQFDPHVVGALERTLAGVC